MEVRGFNVPNGPQPYALVVDNGDLGTAPPPPTVQVHVGDLDGTRALVKRSWNATVTVTVHGGNEGVVSGATVAGTWSGAATGTTTCTTNASGVCAMTKSNLKTNNTSTTFTVTGITGANMTYTAAANHDPEADSNGTAITITKP